jgi:hypothetical protein
LVGVAYRGKIALDDITVEFKVEPLDTSNGMGFGVREVVTLKGQISESERVRLERASNFCPVGQSMSKGSIEFEDEIRWSSGETALAFPVPDDHQPLTGNIPAIPEGTVSGMYLLETKERDESGAMIHEGEAKVSIRYGNLTRPSRSVVVGGHSSDGMVPGPFPLAHSGWLSSTVSTLSRLLPFGAAGAEGLMVELFMPTSPGGPAASQSNAAEGIIGYRQVKRRITVPGTPSEIPLGTIQAALLRDPMSITYKNGGVLLSHDVVVG